MAMELNFRLVRALLEGWTAEATELLAAGADPSSKSAEGISALAIAAHGGLWGACQALIEAGADPCERIPAKAGGQLYLTALDYACAAVNMNGQPALDQSCCEGLALELASRGDRAAIGEAAGRSICSTWHSQVPGQASPVAFKLRLSAAHWVAPWLAEPDSLFSSSPFDHIIFSHRKSFLGAAIVSGSLVAVDFALSICDPGSVCWEGRIRDQDDLIDPQAEMKRLNATELVRAWMDDLVELPFDAATAEDTPDALGILGMVHSAVERRNIGSFLAPPLTGAADRQASKLRI